MTEMKIFRLYITPQTKINISKNERWLFAEGVSDKYLKSFGKKKYDQKVAEGKKNPGSPNDYFNRKQYILKYFDYKRKVKELFVQTGLKEFPTDNFWVRFYIPMPISWTKKKRNQHCFEKHESKPDVTNIFKSLEDSCCIEDKKNWDYRASKFWVDLATGYIEIEVGSLPPAKGYSKFEREDKIK